MQVLIQILALCRHIWIQENRMVSDDGALAQVGALQRLVQTQSADVRDGAPDVRQHIDHHFSFWSGSRNTCVCDWHWEHLRQLQEEFRIPELQSRLRRSHEFSEGVEALPHSDVEVAVIHHRVPTRAHSQMLSPLRRGAHCVPWHIPEVAVIEPSHARWHGVSHSMPASSQHAARMNLSEGSHLQDHCIIPWCYLDNISNLVHRQDPRTLWLWNNHCVLLPCVHLPVQQRHEIGVDMPWQPVVSDII
mmetsp:Transcript_12465/g.34343  ORF Transcript_12465/g.34343 Transcript_12465/m.34343 type:complete len:247 (+) Transcript_12465:1430-2170(+)